MTRAKQPLSKARLTGADRKNPQRYRNRSEPAPAVPIGDPPAFLSAAERNAWRTFVRELPWLVKSDRGFLAAACKLRVMIEDPKEDTTAALLREYRSYLSALGATPVSRSNVVMPPDDEDDPFATLDVRPN